MLTVALFVMCASPLDEGIGLYHALEFEKATITFQRLVLDPNVPPSERALANVWLGLSYGQLGDLTGAREAFSRAVVNDPNVQAPPDAPPTLLGILEEERAKVKVPPAMPTPETKPIDTPAPPPAEPLNWAGIGLGVGAGVLGLAAAGAGVYGAERLSFAYDINNRAVDAFAAYDTAVAAGWFAAALGGAAILSGGASAALFVMD